MSGPDKSAAMDEATPLSTYEKVLQINLDAEKYGVFAEIGAGQETANWFFRASASAGTVAKTISAYDMTMSDALYGKGTRYVSQERVRAMLNYEYDLLNERLSPERGDRSTFFAFSNTVRARGYNDTAECHGWLGIKLQLKPKAPPNEILMHVRLLDKENTDQMEALGVAGVNLIYAAFFHRGNLEQMVNALADNLAPGRIEIDLLRFDGPDFRFVDNRLCALQLVRSGLTRAAMFNPDGDVVQAADALYKRPILLLRGSFNPVLKLHLDMIRQSRALFAEGMTDKQKERAIEICEITMNNLLREGAIDHEDFLDRADALQALGKTVLISNCPEFHRIASYLSLYTAEPIGVILSIGLLNELFKEKWSGELPGGILESFGRLFKNSVSLLVYPWQNRKNGELVTADTFRTPERFRHLYDYFVQNQRIRSVHVRDLSRLAMTGREVTRALQDGVEGWEQYVPKEAMSMAKKLISSGRGDVQCKLDSEHEEDDS